MRFGAHVSIAGGLWKAIDRGMEIGAECLQIFISSPRRWQAPSFDATDIARFLERRGEVDMAPIFVHTIYLLNLSASDEPLRKRSIASLTVALNIAEQLGLDGVVTHLGSSGGRPEEEVEEVLAASLAESLSQAPGRVPLLLETAAGSTMGSTFAQLGRIIQLLEGQRRLAVCLDTAHVFAAGYDLTSLEGLEKLLARFGQEVGLERLLLVHANDSKSGLGSGVDRHENIGKGKIGEEAFAHLLRHRSLETVPFILEVPGFGAVGPDRENLAILRRLAGIVRE